MRDIAGFTVETMTTGHYFAITSDFAGNRRSFHVVRNEAGFAGRDWELSDATTGQLVKIEPNGDTGYPTMTAAFEAVRELLNRDALVAQAAAEIRKAAAAAPRTIDDIVGSSPDFGGVPHCGNFDCMHYESDCRLCGRSIRVGATVCDRHPLDPPCESCGVRPAGTSGFIPELRPVDLDAPADVRERSALRLCGRCWEARSLERRAFGADGYAPGPGVPCPASHPDFGGCIAVVHETIFGLPVHRYDTRETYDVLADPGADCGADYCVDPGNCRKHDEPADDGPFGDPAIGDDNGRPTYAATDDEVVAHTLAGMSDDELESEIDRLVEGIGWLRTAIEAISNADNRFEDGEIVVSVDPILDELATRERYRDAARAEKRRRRESSTYSMAAVRGSAAATRLAAQDDRSDPPAQDPTMSPTIERAMDGDR